MEKSINKFIEAICYIHIGGIGEQVIFVRVRVWAAKLVLSLDNKFGVEEQKHNVCIKTFVYMNFFRWIPGERGGVYFFFFLLFGKVYYSKPIVYNV